MTPTRTNVIDISFTAVTFSPMMSIPTAAVPAAPRNTAEGNGPRRQVCIEATDGEGSPEVTFDA
jgi:hypothetical protein